MDCVRLVGFPAVQQQLFYTTKCICVKCFQAIVKISKKSDLHEINSASPKVYGRLANDVIPFVTQNQFLVKFISLNKSVKLKFHAVLAKKAKTHKFAKKRPFSTLTLVWGHLKIVPSYSAIQIRKSQEIPEYYLKKMK